MIRKGSNLANKQPSAARGKGRRGLEHIDAEVGANLREYRIRAGLSQTDLGAKIGVTFQQIQLSPNGCATCSKSEIETELHARLATASRSFGGCHADFEGLE